MTQGYGVLSPVLAAWVARSSLVHIQSPRKHTNSFSFSLRKVMCPGKDHGEDFPIQGILAPFVKILLLYLWLSLLMLLTFTMNKFAIFGRFIKVYNHILFCCFRLWYFCDAFISTLLFSLYVQIHTSLSISHLSFLNMPFIRIPCSFQSSTREMKYTWNNAPAALPQWPGQEKGYLLRYPEILTCHVSGLICMFDGGSHIQDI